MSIAIKGLTWLGVRTDKFDETCAFYEETLGLPVVSTEEGRRVYRLEDGSAIAVFSEEFESHQHFTTGPVVALRVDDVEQARAELEQAGIEFLSPIRGVKGESRWAHFRGVDGNIYEIAERG